MSSAEEIGRLLRETREERGLDLLAVHDQLSRPITQIEALERGDLTRMPDQALALSTLRRYAVFLGLDGDALALRMIEAWSARPPAPASADPGTVTKVVAAVSAGPDHLRAFTETGQVPRVGMGSTAAPGGYGFGVAPGPPTGTFPVVPQHQIKDSKRAVARARRRLRAPTSLKVLTWAAAGLMVAVLAGLAIYQWRPDWLARSHILRVGHPPATSAAGSSTATGTTPPSSGSSGSQTPSGTSQHPPTSPVATTTNTGASANYTVAARKFVVIIGTTGPCWVQVTSSDSSTPLLVGVQPAGKHLTFDADKGTTLTVQVGSSAVVVSVSIKEKVAFFDAPRVTPFTYVFASASSSTGR